LDLAAEQPAEQLHAVTDAEHRHAQLEHRRVGRRGAGGQGAGRSARQHDRLRVQLADARDRQGAGMDLAVDGLLADAARDQLGVLRAEIQNQTQTAFHPKRRASAVKKAPREAPGEKTNPARSAGRKPKLSGGVYADYSASTTRIGRAKLVLPCS